MASAAPSQVKCTRAEQDKPPGVAVAFKHTLQQHGTVEPAHLDRERAQSSWDDSVGLEPASVSIEFAWALALLKMVASTPCSPLQPKIHVRAFGRHADGQMAGIATRALPSPNITSRIGSPSICDRLNFNMTSSSLRSCTIANTIVFGGVSLLQTVEPPLRGFPPLPKCPLLPLYFAPRPASAELCAIFAFRAIASHARPPPLPPSFSFMRLALRSACLSRTRASGSMTTSSSSAFLR